VECGYFLFPDLWLGGRDGETSKQPSQQYLKHNETRWWVAEIEHKKRGALPQFSTYFKYWARYADRLLCFNILLIALMELSGKVCFPVSYRRPAQEQEVFLTFRGPSNVIYSYNRSQRDSLISHIYFGKEMELNMRWDVGIWTGMGWPRIQTGGGRL